jgi:two-component system, NarL family, response regulator NreC
VAIRILIVEDHTIFLEGLRKMFKKWKDCRIVDEAQTGKEAIKKATSAHPDIILMDITLPDISGIEATKKIIAINPDLKILGLSEHAEKRIMLKMYEAGAVGYLQKDCTFDELIKAIKIIKTGQTYLSQSLTNYAAEIFTHTHLNFKTHKTFLDNLTSREMQTLSLLLKGKSSNEIRDIMDITTKTVSSNRRSIMKKMRVKKFHELMKEAIRLGITNLATEK